MFGDITRESIATNKTLQEDTNRSVIEGMTLIPDAIWQRTVDRLAYYEDLETQGRLLILPCAVGDGYFTIEKFCDEHGKLKEPTAHDSYDCAGCCKPCNAELGVAEWKFHSVRQIVEHERMFGKYVFLTRAEAEAELIKAKRRYKDVQA